MDCSKGGLSLRRWPQPVYSQMHSHSPLHKKCSFFFHQDHSNSLYPYPAFLIGKHTLECQTHLLPPDPYQQSLSLSFSLPQTTPANVTFSYLGWENKLFFSSPPPKLHVRICRHDNLRRWTANVTLAGQPIAFLVTGRHCSLMGFTPMTLGLSRCAHMNENESAGLSGVAGRGRLKCH